MIRSFSSVGHRRRRSTVEMISAAMCLTVLKHVNKDSMLHSIRPRSTSRRGRSPEGPLTQAALFYALIRTATLNGVEPEACLRQVIARIGAHPGETGCTTCCPGTTVLSHSLENSCFDGF